MTISQDSTPPKSLPDLGYGFIRTRGADDHVVVIFSAIKNRPSFRKTRVASTIIHVWETGNSSFFTKYCDQACVALLRQIPSRTKRIILVGQSKAAFGAMLWGSQIATLRPELEVAALAFSPQASVWPERYFRYASYKSMMTLVESDENLRDGLERFGAPMPMSSNFRADIIFGVKNRADLIEAETLEKQSPQCYLHPLPIDTHGSIVPFLVTPDEDLELLTKRIIAGAKNDPDIAQWVSGLDVESLAQQWASLGPQPSLAQLLHALTNLPMNTPLTLDRDKLSPAPKSHPLGTLVAAMRRLRGMLKL